ncbi:MAG: hypothetical protein Q4F13_02560 [Pseudomonadota bacterium]|nr:hypothetical protein [Pseudomonadota bacterium]
MQLNIDTLNLHVHTGHTAFGAELVKAALQADNAHACSDHPPQEGDDESADVQVQITGDGKLPPELADLLDKIFAIANEKPEKGE